MADWHRRQSWLVSLLILAACVPAVGAEKPAKEPASAMLYLTDGDFFTGTLEDSDGPDAVNWQSVGAARPFQFPSAAIRAAYFPPPAHPAPAEADYCFELSDGDLLFGSLVNLTPEAVEIESARFGRLHIERSQIRRLRPWQGSTGWEYSGPNGLAEWQQSPDEDGQTIPDHVVGDGKSAKSQSPNANGWREEAGHLITEAAGDSLRKKIDVPRQASIELAISWNKKPDFAFVIAAGDDKKQENAGVHLEVWNKTLVLVRESKTDADVAAICDLETVKNRLHLQVLLDQEKGSVSVHSLDGAKLAEIEVEADNDAPLHWISLRNQRGDVRLEQLVVSQWSGQLPPQIDVDRQRIHQADGAIVYGDIVRYDADTQQFIVQEEAVEKAVVAQQVASVVLTPATESTAGSVRIGCHDGTRLSGQLAKVESGNVHLSRPGVDEALVFSVADIRCVIGVPSQSQAPQAKLTVGRLELDGVRSHGALVDGKSDESTSCLVWQPRQSATSSPLNHSVSGRIVYRDPPPPPAPARAPQQQVQRRGGFFGAVVQAFSGPPPQNAAPPRLSGYPHALFLLAGDRIPCVVSRIDDQGVHFTSSVVESEMVPHEQIKALELISRTAAASLAEEKRMRLLTLPRMQKDNPPTHLIASTGGDYLRARLQSMDAQTLAAETRLETKRLPRGRVASIIWLHSVSETNPSPAADVAAPPAPVRVQAVRADGVRLTFVPHEFVNNSLVGSSDLLGACQVDVKAVDRILLGSMIEQSSDETLYDAWRLYDAVEPKFVEDETGENPAAAGLNSAFIGKPAPDFRLDLLDGGQFRLSEEKGHIVVLDFWATWCAPCMQGMPEMTQVIQEFENDKVKYVAVNMQEDRATIAGSLERMKLEPTVALDIDGAASERYEVTAIPQVVVIDAAGNVARMFIGADVNFAEQLREALQQLVEQNAPAENEASGQ